MKSELPPSQPARARWMVGDDDAGIREFMAVLLEKTGGVEVARFASATAALAAFAAATGQYQFILTDFEMPGMNGIEFCRRLHALAPGVKVLLVTGDSAINEAEVRRWGFCGLVKKPFPARSFSRPCKPRKSTAEDTFQNTKPLHGGLK